MRVNFDVKPSLKEKTSVGRTSFDIGFLRRMRVLERARDWRLRMSSCSGIEVMVLRSWKVSRVGGMGWKVEGIHGMILIRWWGYR